MYLGIDVSVHNGNINVKQVRDEGYEFIMIRAGYGQNNIDPKFETNASACVNLRIVFRLKKKIMILYGRNQVPEKWQE